jgi:hypothetical protein
MSSIVIAFSDNTIATCLTSTYPERRIEQGMRSRSYAAILAEVLGQGTCVVPEVLNNPQN